MVTVNRARSRAAALLASLAAVSCGGSDSSTAPSPSASPPTPVSNVVAVVVDQGPASATNPTVNTLYTSVTVCVPGSTTECQTIDHIQVDTGSYGLRILAPVLMINLPLTNAPDANALVECTKFVDGYSWGPVATADMQVSGEKVASLPLQLIGAANFTNVPADCSSSGPAEQTVATFGANGILGIGPFQYDCFECNTNSSNLVYYSCSATACTPTVAPLANEVQNPVPLFATDNNGTIIVLPAVSPPGAATLSGSLLFGIDTESNNASGTETVLTLDGMGEFTTTLNGASLKQSFIDSGTNGLFFDDSAIPTCSSQNFTDFYCPASAENLSATLSAAGTSAASATIAFSIGNAQTLVTNDPTFAALPTLSGTYSTSQGLAGATFDWGLPFFYNRRVATAIEGGTTAVGTGPYVAF